MTSIFKNLKNVKNKFRNQKSELAKNRRPTDKSSSGDPRTLTMFVKSRGVRWSCHSRKHTGQQSIKKANQFSKEKSDGTHKIFYVKARKTILLNEELTEMFLFCFVLSHLMMGNRTYRVNFWMEHPCLQLLKFIM